MTLTVPATHHAEVVLGSEPGALAGLLDIAQRAAASGVASGAKALIPVTQSIEFGPDVVAGEALEVRAWIDRATRTLMFLQSQAARAGGGPVVATGSGVYRIAAD